MTSGIFNRALLTLLIIPSLITVKSQTNLDVTTSLLVPQLQTFDNETTYWRSMVSFNQMGKRFDLHVAMDLGSATSRYVNPFRIYELNARLKLGRHSLSLGRLIHWSSLTHVRVDGIESIMKTKRFGQLKILGGFKTVDDFSDTSFVQSDFFKDNHFLDKTFFLASWSNGRFGKSINLSIWGDGKEDTISPFVGMASSYTINTFRLNQSLVIDGENSRIYYGRFNLFKSFKSHRLGLGYRQGRYDGIFTWHWMKDITIPPTFSLSWTWNKLNQFYLHNRLNMRPGVSNAIYLNSSVVYKKITISFLSGSRNNSQIIGGAFGISNQFGKSITYGGNISLNVINYGELLDPVNASSIYGWLNWEILEILRMKFFGRYSINPYYKKDGRAGVVVYVKI
ncbi:MAG: hypothetical protein ISR82_03370 [Candidatus Marinimicrobia bacterium]|nr:hypothetical protein [Candidatus Neomarinimicrobiota bacterium]MBL7010243.1 hypothetical protein [Candidatus Neomarinimicrobiota bacterium]MBL7030658.1 hypothetical protein [Candidatus Neomarinimicrobiota bacterium]